MKKAAVNYKLLYNKSLEKISEKENQIAAERELLKEAEKVLVTERALLAKAKEDVIEKDQRIIQLNFELDKFRKYHLERKVRSSPPPWPMRPKYLYSN